MAQPSVSHGRQLSHGPTSIPCVCAVQGSAASRLGGRFAIGLQRRMHAKHLRLRGKAPLRPASGGEFVPQWGDLAGWHFSGRDGCCGGSQWNRPGELRSEKIRVGKLAHGPFRGRCPRAAPNPLIDCKTGARCPQWSVGASESGTRVLVPAIKMSRRFLSKSFYIR